MTTGVDVDADDEGDDEQEDIDVTIGAGLDVASHRQTPYSLLGDEKYGKRFEANHYVYF